ncbi:MAG: SLC13 family permease [Xanthomonadales bacterium]|nr:SLC13 family permease [Xanthomonadales bacterium]
MGPDALLVLGLLVLAMVLFASEKLPVDIVALLVLVLLLVLGLVTPTQGLSGFSSQATITVAAMFVLSAGLQRTGALRFVAGAIARWGHRPWLLVLMVMASVGLVSAFVNNTAAVAVFLPLVMAATAQRRLSASKVLIPLSYASQMGGVCTLIGTSTNLLVHAIARDMGLPGFSMFEFTLLGLVTMAVGFVYLLLAGPWLLPERRGGELTADYQLGKYITELRVPHGAGLVGRSVEEARLGEQGVFVLELLRDDGKVWSPRSQRLRAGDVLLVRGDWRDIQALRERERLAFEPEFRLRDEALEEDDRVLVEAMVAPTSRLAGTSLAAAEFHWHTSAAVLAIQRRGEVIREKLKHAPLALGDVLLLLVPAGELAELRRNPNLLVLTEKEDDTASRRRAPLALAIMAGVVAFAALGLADIVVTALAGCVLMVLTGCLRADDVYDAIDWRVIILLAGILPLGIALTSSGAAQAIAGQALALVGGAGPVAALAVVYLLTAILTEAMSNNACAVLMAPVAVATAQGLGVDPTPFLVAVAFAASTSFATPVGYQTNTMVYNAGGYRFADFVRIGVPLNVLFAVVAITLIPVLWPLG